MPDVMPFRAWRYAPQTDLLAVTTPPYDVLSDAEVAMYKARDAHNISHVDLPSQTPEGYREAGETLRAWMASGVLVRDQAPTLTLYRLSFDDATGASRTMLGVLAAVPVVNYGDGGVLPHENVTAKASTDRLDLTRATGANLSPVWGLSLAPGFARTLEAIWQQAPGRPSNLSEQGVTHEVLPIADEPSIAAVRALASTADVLIADGHHRYGVAQRYRAEVGPGPADYTLMFVSELVADQLNIEAIHRLYDGVPFAVLRDALAQSFDLAPAGVLSRGILDQMVESAQLVLVAPDGSAEWMTPRPGQFEGLRPLDGLWLEHALEGVDGLSVTYQHGLDEVQGVVGQHSGAVLIRPTTIEEIRRTATEGLLMPPKSTFFTPKLRTGLVVRSLDQ